MDIKTIIFVCALQLVNCQLINERFYPRFHLAPPSGWMNDPNGFCVYNSEYHLFYQHDPDTSLQPGSIHWGHAKSTNLMDWEHLPIALYPDQSYDSGGVFSGSAIVENDTMYLWYTAHQNHPNATPDHEEHQALATSTDGLNFTKYENNPVLLGEDLQPDIRDPKVWVHNGTYYMILGNSVNATGRVLLYSSENKINWTLESDLSTHLSLGGYMWECPDFFELDGKFVLLFSPQGLYDGDIYRNLYQTGYIIGNFSYETKEFWPESDFILMDHGHDFYATQTIEDAGKRIMVAWFDMWEQVYLERQDGFTGMITLPRTLTIVNNHIIQKPIAAASASFTDIKFRGSISPGQYISLPNNAGFLNVKASSSHALELIVSSKNSSSNVIIKYDPLKGTVSLERGRQDSERIAQWKPTGATLQWQIFIDASAVELFCGDGEITFSSRFFPEGQVKVSVARGNNSKMTVKTIKE